MDHLVPLKMTSFVITDSLWISLRDRGVLEVPSSELTLNATEDVSSIQIKI